MFNWVEIEICPLCNRSCSFCPLSQDKILRKPMDEKLFQKILDELAELKFSDEICLSSFGEPLLDERLAEFSKRIKTMLNSKITILTNGDFLTSEKLKDLLTAGIDQIVISQHDKEPSKAIEKLFSEVNSEEKDHLYFQVVNENVPLSNFGGSVEVKILKPPICRPQAIFIRSDGEIRFCCSDYYCQIKLGNVNKSKLIDIWNLPFYKKIRDEIRNGIFNLEICKKCRGIP